MLLVTITTSVYAEQLSSTISRMPDCGEVGGSEYVKNVFLLQEYAV
jgi:hypothetical protein